VNRRRLLRRLSQGSLNNVRFSDLVDLAEGLGFRLARTKGFAHPSIPEMVNLQNTNGEAKPYQIRQLLRLVERYNLMLEDRE